MKTSLSGNVIPSDHFSAIGFLNEPDQLKKVGKVSRIEPSPTERIVPMTARADLFKDLQFMNLLMTNHCNLSCSYCYEQHQKDFGRFDVASLKRAWDFMRSINGVKEKTLQFFGGEPLIHQKLILEFIDAHFDEIAAAKGDMNLSITSNGLLLTEAFLDRYFSLPNTKLMISLDTLDAKVDHRAIGQEKIDWLIEMCGKITSRVSNPHRFAIRATVSKESAPGLRKFWEALYAQGVRQLVFHPLILSYTDGYLPWTTEEWDAFTGTIKGIVRDYPDEVSYIRLVEGVGIQGETNCLTGSDTISIDPSGDFSGCYFFTNRKGSNTGDFIIGNIFRDELFIDRYEHFQKMYSKMFQEEEQCRTCNLKKACYQCPAGNISTGEKLFRPDDMCKRFVQLHLDIKDLVLQQTFKDKLTGIFTAYRDEGPRVYAKISAHLFHYFHHGEYPDKNYVDRLTDENSEVDASLLLGYFLRTLKEGYGRRSLTVDLQEVFKNAKLTAEKSSPKEVYDAVLEKQNVTQTIDQGGRFSNLDADLLYMTLLHFVIANRSRHKTFGMGG